MCTNTPERLGDGYIHISHCHAVMESSTSVLSYKSSVQVETIRDAYMVVAGVPNKTTFHAHHICDMALDMLSSIDHLKDPSTGDNIQIRVGK